MAEEVREVVEGDGWALGNVDALSDEPAVYLIAGGKDGYVGRDGRLPEGETSRFGPSGQPGS